MFALSSPACSLGGGPALEGQACCGGGHGGVGVSAPALWREGEGRKNLSLQRAEAGVGTAGIWAEGRNTQGQQGKEKSVMAS